MKLNVGMSIISRRKKKNITAEIIIFDVCHCFKHISYDDTIWWFHDKILISNFFSDQFSLLMYHPCMESAPKIQLAKCTNVLYYKLNELVGE